MMTIGLKDANLFLKIITLNGSGYENHSLGRDEAPAEVCLIAQRRALQLACLLFRAMHARAYGSLEATFNAIRAHPAHTS